jgi:ABC-type methionine transport system ATPase subunit
LQKASRVFCSHTMTHVDINVTAGREQVQEPWIWRLARDFNVKVNVRKANIDSDFGWAQLELEGSVEEIQRATAWLMTTGLNVEALQRAVGA